MADRLTRLTRDELDRLCDVVAATDTTSRVSEPKIVTALYRLLGFEGRPVTADRLATAIGWDEDRCRLLLGRLPNVEWDERGVVGFGGLTLRPTPHEIVFHGRTRYAWCAWDTLFLAVALDTRLTVRSTCPSTHRPVNLTVSPTGIVEREPDTAVLSFVRPHAVDADDLRSSFCGEVHFFVDPAAAEPWRGVAANRLVLDLDDAFDLGRHLIVTRCGCCIPDTSPDRSDAR